MRTQIDNGTLAMMVLEELQVRVSARGGFTAYDITRSLRRKNLFRRILHTQVRSYVHQCMEELVGADEYRSVMRRFGNKTAIMYLPAPYSPQRGIPNVPLLPLN